MAAAAAVEVAAAAAVMVAVEVAAAVAVAAVLHVAAVEVAAALQVSVAALQVYVAALQVFAALEVSMYAALSGYIADAHFSDAASAAVVVGAEAAEAGVVELAGYGHPPGAGSTPAGPNLRLRVKLASRRSKSNKQRWLRKRSDESYGQSSSASRQF